MYKNPIPVVVGIVPVYDNHLQDHKFLAIHRSTLPTGLAFPGGYVDEMESAQQAMVREFKEEVGLDTNEEEWSLVTTRVSAKNHLIIFLQLDDFIVHDSDLLGFVPNSEVASLHTVIPGDQLVFPSHTELLAAFR